MGGVLEIAGNRIPRGGRVSIEIPVAKLYTDTEVYMPVHIIRGKKDGPSLFVSAAIHGDELNGIEIVRRLIQSKTMKITHGTLYLVPMVNVYGVLNQSRYMPDRRDLNRSFPGSPKGSLAGRVAHIFMSEIVDRCQYGIDLHTGALHRSNLPQIRADLNDDETRELAESFGVPVLLNSDLRDGSLRESAVENDTRVLLYEAGQALRFDEISIRAGVRGVENVLYRLGMRSGRKRRKVTPYIANTSRWIRANDSGIVVFRKHLGDMVQQGDVLASIGSPFGVELQRIIASRSGIIIGRQNIPLVQEGDALIHIAFFSEPDEEIADDIETLHEQLMPESVAPLQNAT